MRDITKSPQSLKRERKGRGLEVDSLDQVGMVVDA
jgi:hypothetical protein